VTAPRVSLPTSVDLTMTPATPTVAAVQRYAPTAVALVLTGATPQIGGSVSVIPVAASLSFAGDVPAVRTPVALDPSAVALFLAFAGPVVIATDNLRLTPGPLGLVLTPAIPDVTIPSLMPGIAARMHIVAMPPLQLAIAPRPAAAIRVLPASDAPATSPGDSR
jgi:hypothetical protein